MAEEFNIEDEHALKALTYAVSLIECKEGTVAVRDKLAASRLVLDYTKAKPATSQNVTLNSAEEFLAALADKETKT